MRFKVPPAFAFICYALLLSLSAYGLESPPPAKDELVRKWEVLAAAVASGDLAAMRKAIDDGAPVNYEAGDPQESVLLTAVRTGKKEIVEALLGNGADPNAAKTADTCALYAAARRFDRPIGKLLLAHGAKWKWEKIQGKLPSEFYFLKDFVNLCWASPKEMEAANLTIDEAHETLNDELLELIGKDNVDIKKIEELIAKGADPNTMYTTDFSPLHYASSRKDAKVVEALLNSGANPNPPCGPTPRGSPLLCAVQNGRLESVLVLLSHNASMNALDKDGKTPLDWAKDEAIAKALKDAGGKSGADLKKGSTWSWKTDNGDKPGTALVLNVRDGKAASGKFYILDPNAPGDLTKGVGYDLEHLVQDGNRITCSVTIVDASSPDGRRKMNITLTLKGNLVGDGKVAAEFQSGGGAAESIELMPEKAR